MDKITISIRIPALDITHDFIIPFTMKMADVRQLVVDILASEYGVKKTLNSVSFVDLQDGKSLIMEASAYQLDLGDGTKLVML